MRLAKNKYILATRESCGGMGVEVRLGQKCGEMCEIEVRWNVIVSDGDNKKSGVEDRGHNRGRVRVGVWYVCSLDSLCQGLHICHGRATKLVSARPVDIRAQWGRAWWGHGEAGRRWGHLGRRCRLHAASTAPSRQNPHTSRVLKCAEGGWTAAVRTVGRVGTATHATHLTHLAHLRLLLLHEVLLLCCNSTVLTTYHVVASGHGRTTTGSEIGRSIVGRACQAHCAHRVWHWHAAC